MKRAMILMAGAISAATLLSAALPVSRVLIWNVSASVPTGLYHMRGTSGLNVGERVAIDPSQDMQHFLAARGYLPSGVPLLKEIAALPGDIVCRLGAMITINGMVAGEARSFDRWERPLPDWQGCRAIACDEIFVMNLRAADSFDGRYFGPVKRAQLIGRASPVWTDEGGNGVHVWFARPTIPASNHHQKETKYDLYR
jgi:conjugative transfer signal peptidase TraF